MHIYVGIQNERILSAVYKIVGSSSKPRECMLMGALLLFVSERMACNIIFRLHMYFLMWVVIIFVNRERKADRISLNV